MRGLSRFYEQQTIAYMTVPFSVWSSVSICSGIIVLPLVRFARARTNRSHLAAASAATDRRRALRERLRFAGCERSIARASLYY